MELNGPALVISPHLDDGVMGCGDLLARLPGSSVLTIFAGAPPTAAPLTEWDGAAGFGSSNDVMPARRAEDRCALDLLSASPIWLDFLDAQYGHPPAAAAIARAIDGVLAKEHPSAVYLPLGLFHSDHKLVHRAGLKVLRARPGLRWHAYADALYRRIPGLMSRKLAVLRRIDIGAEPVPEAQRTASELKRQAVSCYRSQLRALATVNPSAETDLLLGEQYWRLRAPRGCSIDGGSG
jgi:LmbE family N-acetylglucosaminyl deacetylase